MLGGQERLQARLRDQELTREAIGLGLGFFTALRCPVRLSINEYVARRQEQVPGLVEEGELKVVVLLVSQA